MDTASPLYLGSLLYVYMPGFDQHRATDAEWAARVAHLQHIREEEYKKKLVL